MSARRFTIACIALSLFACDGPPPRPDAMAQSDAGPALCARDQDCDDGRYCNGAERCDPGGAGSDVFGCVASDAPCLPGQTCDEAASSCTTDCDVALDADGDGHDAIECAGDDCDDSDADRYPGNVEVCDLFHHDEDCNPETFGLLNTDSDGFPSSACCNRDASDLLRCGSDCDDTRREINPEASEECDGIDNNCDGNVDESLIEHDYHPDCDGDMFGARGTTAIRGCRAPAVLPLACAGAASARWAENASDCDDTAPGVNPGATDVCNGIDDDCDGVLEGVGEDVDRDGFGGSGCGGGSDCDDSDPLIRPGAVERCNGLDDDCDGAPSIGEDADGDGYLGAASTCVGGPLAMLPRLDCDDGDASISPLATELCDGVDRNCDGVIDEEPAASLSCARDHALTSCSASACVLDGCAGTYADCNGALDDGCEVDTASSIESCGACGRACWFHCAHGACDDPRTIGAGAAHTCALLPSGHAVCWGDNSEGQLGNGTTIGSPRAALVVTTLSAASVTLGTRHTCLVEATGQVSCWGAGIYGQLGNGSTSSHSSPVPVTGLDDAVRVFGGANHTCAIRSDGSLACWGWNLNGQLGDGTTTNRSTFITVPGVTDALGIALGTWHTCAIVGAGSVMCWGGNDEGQLGDGTRTRRLVPTAVSGITDAVDIVAGAKHTCVLHADRTISCWGDGTTSPTSVSGITDAIAVAAGGNQSCAIGASGQAVCWGSNFYGQLGDGTTVDRATPTPVSGLTDAVSISTNGGHTCALRASGEALCWGSNVNGEIGNGTMINRNSPAPILPL